MNANTAAFRIAAARRMLYREGCDSNVSGHVSTRAEELNAFWVTPFQYFDQTLPHHVAKVSFDMDLLEGDHMISPAVEFHAGIYESRPDVNAIVHTHSKYVSVLASTGALIGMYNVAAAVFHADQVYYADDGTEGVEADRRDKMATTLGVKNVLLFANHGAVIVGPSIEVATIKAIMLEQAAWYHLQCSGADGQEIAPAVAERNKAAYEKYFIPNMWQQNLERLEASDPDMFAEVTARA